MKKEEKDFSEKMKENGWREINRSERPNAAIEKSLQESKKRITIYLDADVIEHFKRAGERTKEGYQTLINRTLRAAVASPPQNPAPLTEDKLFERAFLSKLKAELQAI